MNHVSASLPYLSFPRRVHTLRQQSPMHEIPPALPSPIDNTPAPEPDQPHAHTTLSTLLADTFEDMMEEYTDFQSAQRRLLRENGVTGAERLGASRRTRRSPLPASGTRTPSRGSISLKTIEEPPLSVGTCVRLWMLIFAQVT